MANPAGNEQKLKHLINITEMMLIKSKKQTERHRQFEKELHGHLKTLNKEYVEWLNSKNG